MTEALILLDWIALLAQGLAFLGLIARGCRWTMGWATWIGVKKSEKTH